MVVISYSLRNWVLVSSFSYSSNVCCLVGQLGITACESLIYLGYHNWRRGRRENMKRKFCEEKDIGVDPDAPLPKKQKRRPNQELYGHHNENRDHWALSACKGGLAIGAHWRRTFADTDGSPPQIRRSRRESSFLRLNIHIRRWITTGRLKALRDA